MNTDMEKLRALGPLFTTAEAANALGSTLSTSTLAYRLSELGFDKKSARRAGDSANRQYWCARAEQPACTCRCHAGTCGANDMILAQRTIDLVAQIRPTSAEMIELIDDLVRRAGVEFAKDAMDEMLF